MALKEKKRKVFLYSSFPSLHSPATAYKTNLLGEQDHTQNFLAHNTGGMTLKTAQAKGP